MKDRMFFYRDNIQGFFITLLVLYIWFFPVHSFLRGLLNIFADIVGTQLRSGAPTYFGVSHRRHTRSRTSKPQHSLPQGHMPVYESDLSATFIGLGRPPVQSF
jgi:hypothetical protein